MVRCHHSKCIAFVQIKDPEPSLAESHGVRQHRLEYRRKLGGGVGNNAQHLGGCLLALYCLV